MGNRENHRLDLNPLFDGFLETRDEQPIRAYLVANSNLPGRRANLELAEAFGDVVADRAGPENVALWRLCHDMAAISAAEASVNDPFEFVPFCGTVGIGALGSVSPESFAPAVDRLKTLANDPRWRMREAVRMGLQRLMVKRGQDTLSALERWIAEGSLLELRAVAATVAEPALLADHGLALFALELHRQIFDRLFEIEARRSEDFRVLRQALGYTLSLVVYAVPEQGFTYMVQLVDRQDTDVRWIVQENLKKRRLTKNFPDEVAEIKELLNTGS